MDTTATSRWIARTLALLLFVGVTASGCGEAQLNGLDKNQSGADDPADDAAAYVPQELLDKEGLHVLPWVDFLAVPDTVSQGVSIDRSTWRLTFSGAAAELAADIRRGDVVYGHAQGGFARQVVSVERSGEQINYETRELNLSNVVYGEWQMQLPLGGEGLSEGTMSTRRQPLGASVNFGGIGSAGAGLTVSRANLGVEVQPVLDFSGYIKVRGGPLSVERGDHCQDALVDQEYMCLFGRCGGELKVCVNHLRTALDITLSPSLAAQLSVEASLEKKFPAEAYPIFERALPGVNIGATPFTISPKVSVTAQASAKATAKGTLDITASGSVGGPAGFEYRAGNFDVLNPISDGTSSLSISATPDMELSASVGVTLGTSLEFGVSLTGLGNRLRAGSVAAGVDLKAEARYTPTGNNECLAADVTLNPFVEASLELEVDASPIFDFNRAFASVQQNLGSATLASWSDNGEFCPMCPVSAETGQDPFKDTCVTHFMYHCYEPEGQCTGIEYPDGSYEMSWDSGHEMTSQVESTSELEGDFSETRTEELFDIDGAVCVSGDRVVDISSGAQQAECISLVEYVLDQDQEEAAPGSDHIYKKGDLLSICHTSEGLLKVDCAEVDAFEVQIAGPSGNGSDSGSEGVDSSCLMAGGADSQCEWETSE